MKGNGEIPSSFSSCKHFLFSQRYRGHIHSNNTCLESYVIHIEMQAIMK